MTSPQTDLDVLKRLHTIATDLGIETLAHETQTLAERVAEGRFFVACVGQFKRGKSSLLNALVGMSVLPTGIVPITAVPTILRYGPTLAARIHTYADGWRPIAVTALEDYVSEEQNPENRRGVEAVEICMPSSVLADGLCLVDTPGIGSVFAGNTATTRDFVPHIDVALVVVGVDPPLGGEELALIETVARQAPALLVVLNKADRFTDDERASAIAFTRRILTQRVRRSIDQVFEVSALEQLAPAPADTPTVPPSDLRTVHPLSPRRDWDRLLTTLHTLARTSGAALVATARVRGTRRLIDACLVEIDAQHDALTQPIAASEARLETLGGCVHDAAQRILDLGHLFAAEQHRLGDTFAERRRAFLDRAIPQAHAELDRGLTTTTTRWGPAHRRDALAAARIIGRRWVEPWLAEEHQAAEAAYRTIADRFVTMASDWLAAVARSGNDDLKNLPPALDREEGFRVPSRYTFQDILPLVYGSPLQTVLDVLRPPTRQQRIVRRDAQTYLTNLCSMNTTLVQNDLDQRVTESRTRLAAELQGYLQRVYQIVERALVRARAAHAAGARAVADTVARLRDLRHHLLALCHSVPASDGTRASISEGLV